MASGQFPIRCIEHHPSKLTIRFMGCAINLTYISNYFTPPLSPSYLSKVFRMERKPSLDYAERIAEALGMSTGAFVEGLKSHRHHRAEPQVGPDDFGQLTSAVADQTLSR